jgi:hypothetical protein
LKSTSRWPRRHAAAVRSWRWKCTSAGTRFTPMLAIGSANWVTSVSFHRT